MSSRPPKLTREQSDAIAARDCQACGKHASEETGGRNGCVAFHDGERWQFRAECVACWNASVERDRAQRAAEAAARPRCEGCGKGQRSYVMMPGTPHATEVCRGCKTRVDARLRMPLLFGTPSATRAQILSACAR